jgi:NAD(P)-dependent dehydrogenase (short-subunit alcohol dehydrogenase family)
LPGLDGKVLIITGSGGVSAAAARRAAEAGARLLIATPDEPAGMDLAAATGAVLWAGDLTRPASADSILSLCLAHFARVDGLFHASGLSGRRYGDGPVHECTDEGIEVTLAANLGVAFRLGRAVCGRLLVQEPDERSGQRGAIVNLGSALADAPEPRHFATHAYAAAKGAAVALSRSMAAYYAPHQSRVNVVAPAFVGTEVSERSLPLDLADFVRRKQPLTGGMVDPADVARAALFLLSDEARPITGQILAVDAGWSLTGV